MSVDAMLAYTLARQTGFGAELCKFALERAKNDVELALKLLKRWGGSKVSNNSTKLFGAVCTYFEAEHSAATAVEMTCSDELFAKSRKFYELVGQTASEIVSWGEAYVAEPEIKDIEKERNITINIKSARFERSNPLCLLTTYTHRDSIAVVLETEVKSKEAFDNRQFRLFSFDLAMHIAAFSPLSLNRDDIPGDIKHEVQVQIEKQLAQDGKDVKFWAVASEGKLNKWAEQRTLFNQIFAKSDKDSVDDVRKKVGEKIGSEVTIKRFARFAVGS